LNLLKTTLYCQYGLLLLQQLRAQKQSEQKFWSPCFYLPYGKKAIRTKWVYRNKKDERGVVVRNKVRLVAQGHRQEEGIDYDEVFAPMARIEAIRIFLSFASYMGFIVYQMDVKSAFLYGIIDEERSWCDEFEALMKSRFQTSSMGELTFFLGLQVKQKEDGIFISQDKYVAEILKKFDFSSVKTASTPIETQKPLVKDEEASDVDVHIYRSMIGSLMYLTASRPDIMFAVCACSRFQVTPKTSHLSAVKRIFRYLKGKPKLGLWYPRVSSFDLESYSDSDYAGANLDRKSTTGGCQFLGRRLISWQCKKQTIVATSTTEAEYVAAASCCGQVLWIQNQMLDYGFNFMNTKIYIDNESTICIVKNPVYHSKTKHIAIRHHFIRDAYEKKLIQVLKIHTDDNVADLLTKAFDVSRSCISRGLKEFRELLSRVTNGTEALLLPTLFFLELDKVSTASAKLVPLGKVCTALELLKKNTDEGTNKMAVLDSCPKHNMVAYLEKSEGNEEFHEIIDFLKRSSIHFALTVSPIVSTTFVEQFWTSAKSKTINNVRHITAKVAGKSVSISEASIRSDLRFDDADGIDTLPNQAIFDAIQLIGSKSTSWDQISTNIATAVICLTSNQKYNFSKLIFDGKQLDDVPVPLDHFSINTLTSKVFSFMVKKGKHFSGKVTLLFATMLIQPTQDEGASSERPSEAQPTPSPAPTSEVPYEPQTDSSPAQTSEVPIEHQPNPSPRPSPSTTTPAFIPETSGENLGGHSSSDKSLSGNEGDMTIQGVYDLCLSLCKQVSDQAKEIQALKAQITKLKKQAKPVIKHHKAYLKSVSLKQRFPRKSFSKKHRVHKESVSKQGRKFAKGESSVQRDPLFDGMPEDTVDHMETENAQDEGRTREVVDKAKEIEENVLSTKDVLSTDKDKVSTDKEKVSTDRPIVSTDGSKVSTDRQNEGTKEKNEGIEEKNKGTEEHIEGTEEHIEGTEEQVKSTDGHKKAKAVSREKEKGVELKDVEETDRPRPTSTRSLLTLKPLPKIDPKDKGKKKIEEEDESESESDGIPEAEKNKLEEESKEEVQKESKEERVPERENHDDSEKENDELRLHLTIAPDEEKEVDYELLDRKYPIKEWKTECLGTKPQTYQAEHLEEINQNVVIRNYIQDELPKGFDKALLGRFDCLSSTQMMKTIMVQMLKLKLESKEDSTMALELIKFVKKLLAEHKNWLVHKQMTCGKDLSNPFMVDNLPKIVSSQRHLAPVVKSLAKSMIKQFMKYGLDSSASVDTPMVEKMKLDEDRQGKLVDPTRFRGMVGSLMYLSASRPDIVFAVCMCARYQAKPTKKHLHAIKRIFRYLKGTINMGLWYSKDSDFALSAFADTDYVGC
ncbi:putative ribonuclease H-like domain-containing protein, partial [Tanacetum coccineum]